MALLQSAPRQLCDRYGLHNRLYRLPARLGGPAGNENGQIPGDQHCFRRPNRSPRLRPLTRIDSSRLKSGVIEIELRPARDRHRRSVEQRAAAGADASS